MSIKQGARLTLSLLLVSIMLLPGIGGTVPGLAQGDPETRLYRQEYSWVGAVEDCGPDRPGEGIAFTATFFAVYHSTASANGNWLHLERSNLHGEGVGLTTGDRYIISAYGPEWVWSTYHTGPDPVATYTVNGRIRVVRLGGPGVWYTHILWHYTVNANGELAVDFTKLTGGCH